MTTGTLIRTRRKELKLTLRDLSRRTGLSIAMISDIENGKKLPVGGRSLRTIMIELGIDPNELYRTAHVDLVSRSDEKAMKIIQEEKL